MLTVENVFYKLLQNNSIIFRLHSIVRTELQFNTYKPWNYFKYMKLQSD